MMNSFKSTPLVQHQVRILNYDEIVNFLEFKKQGGHPFSEKNQREDLRILPSELSARFLTNSGGHSQAGLTSPNLSQPQLLHNFKNWHKKRGMQRYLSLSFAGHRKGPSGHFQLIPDMVHRQRNSIEYKAVGVSDFSKS